MANTDMVSDDDVTEMLEGALPVQPRTLAPITALERALMDVTYLSIGKFTPTPAWPIDTFINATSSAEPPPVVLDETIQMDPVRAWKRVRVDRPNSIESEATPIVLSRHSKRPFIDLEQATCMKAGSGETICIDVPSNGCTCGYYGWADPEFEDRDNYSFGDVEVGSAVFRIEPWAEVDFYGRIVKHTFGYRAEYQRIVAFHLESAHAIALDGWGFGDFNTLAGHLGAPIIYNGNEYK